MVEGLEYSRNAGMDEDALSGIKEAFRLYADEYLAADQENTFFKRYAEQRGYLEDNHLDPTEISKIMDDYIGADEWYKLATDMTVAMSKAAEEEQQNPGSVEWINYHDIEEAVAEGVARGTNGDNKDTAMADGLNGLKGLPAAVARAVVQAVSKIKVNLDGREVGEATAPYVSQAIGGRAYAELR